MRKAEVNILCTASIVIIFVFSSCNPPIYNPNKMHVPMLNAKGDFQIEGGTDFAMGFTMASAYALDSHFAVRGGACYKNAVYDPPDYTKQHSLEFGLGFFGSTEWKVPWEVYLSFMGARSDYFGIANRMSGDNGPKTRIESDYWRIALQGDIMTNEVWVKDRKISNQGFLDHILSLRLGYINFFHYNEDEEGKITTALPKLLSGEFSTTLRTGIYPIFFEIQFGFVIPIFRSNDFGNINPGIFSFGATLCFY